MPPTARPKIENEPPKIENEPPKIENEPPKIDVPPKKPRRPIPQFVFEDPKPIEGVPKVGGVPLIKPRTKIKRLSLLVLAIASVVMIVGLVRKQPQSEMREGELFGRQNLINYCEEHSADALELCSSCANKGYTLEMQITVDESELQRDNKVLLSQSSNFNLTYKAMRRLLATFFIVTPKDTVALTVQLKELKSEMIQAMCAITHSRRTEHLGTMIGYAPMKLKGEAMRTKFLKTPVVSFFGAVVVTADGEANKTDISLVMATTDSPDMVYCEQARYDQTFVVKQIRLHIFSADGAEFEEPPSIKFITRCHVAEPLGF